MGKPDKTPRDKLATHLRKKYNTKTGGLDYCVALTYCLMGLPTPQLELNSMENYREIEHYLLSYGGMSGYAACETLLTAPKESNESIRRRTIAYMRLSARMLKRLKVGFEPDYKKKYSPVIYVPPGSNFYRDMFRTKKELDEYKKILKEATPEERKRAEAHIKAYNDNAERLRRNYWHQEKNSSQERLIESAESNFFRGLHQLTDDPKTVKEILILAGYETEQSRRDFWKRRKAASGFWEPGISDRLTSQEESPPEQTPVPSPRR
jgi:hypothetical protein